MRYTKPPKTADLGAPLLPKELAAIIDECIDQPQWRANADKEADYADGNQLDTALLRKLQDTGVPPAKEDIIGPAIRAICGYEAKTRTDWRVTPDGDPDGQDVGDALNYRLNQAERYSKADEAMSEAFKPQAGVGLGWVEVARSSDVFGYNKRCRYVHRNEIYWDMRAKESDLSDATWLIRERFIKRSRAMASFPSHRNQIEQAEMTSGLGGYGGYVTEGGHSTSLYDGLHRNRAWTTREQAWYRKETDEVCILEVWYRRWVECVVLKMKGGRVVEFDMENPKHQVAVATGAGFLERTVVARVRRSYWMGPVCLHDSASPYPHQHFPYVPFWGYREDMTNVPFGLIRGMLFPQDNLNSTQAKLRWGLASVMTVRTKGAVAMSDEQFRRQIARPDADIILNPEAMAEEGAMFDVRRDFQLNAQQFQMMDDARRSIQRVSPVTPAFQGQEGTARSGVQEATQVEQSEVSIADLMDNFKAGRTMVGELLLAMEIEDLAEEEDATIVIEGDTLNPARKVVLNHPERDPETGMLYLSNDVSRTRMKVALEDVPSTASFRAQQLQALTEVTKALPPEYQKVLVPFVVDVMDSPRKKQIVEALRAAADAGQQDPEAIREMVKQELMYDLKLRELDMKERESDAKIKKLVAEAVQTGVQAAFSSMSAATQVAQFPMAAPIADKILQNAGYQPAPGGVDPNIPIPPADQTAAMNIKSPFIQGQGPFGAEVAGAAEVDQNTSPTFPPVPPEPGTGQTGIETATPADNLSTTV